MRLARCFFLDDIELEKGSKKSPYGNLEKNYSYILVTKTEEGYKYELQVKDDTYSIPLTEVKDLDKNDMKKSTEVTNSELKPAAVYTRYSIGDVVSFAGSEWYVIENSAAGNDYVTLMSAGIRTVSSFGDTSSYGSSAVKNILEEYANSTLGSDNLKEINGYKIRLITKDELQQNLGYSTSLRASWYEYSQENTPQWVYSYSAANMGYWTMSADGDRTDSLLCVAADGKLSSCSISSSPREVRPVINLLKSSINTN